MRNRTAVLLAGGIVASLALAAVIYVVARPSEASSQVSVRDGGTVNLRGVTLTVPANAVTSDGRLVASTVDPPPVPDVSDAHGAAVRHATDPVSLRMDGTQLTGHSTVSIYVPGDALPSDPVARARPDAVWLASYDPGTQTWVPAESRYDPVAGTVTAVVGHLSWWGVQTWNWASLAIQLRDKLAEFKTLRAAHTDCPNVPGVSVTVDGSSDTPAMGCATSSGGNLTVTVTNNRGYAMVVRAPADATEAPSTYKGFEEFERKHSDIEQVLGGAYLAAGETLTYTIPGFGPQEVFVAEPSWKTHVFDLSVAAAEIAFGVVTLGYSDCILDSVARSEPAPLSDAPGMVVECFPGLAQASTSAKIFAHYVAPLLDVVRGALGQYDEIRDDLLSVHGRVTVDRPSAPPPDLFIDSGMGSPRYYTSRAMPESAAIDNFDGIRGLHWTTSGADQAVGEGTLVTNNCTPDCSQGSEVDFRVRITASNPQTCTFAVSQDYSSDTHRATASIYTRLNVEALSGSPPSYLLGDQVFVTHCG